MTIKEKLQNLLSRLSKYIRDINEIIKTGGSLVNIESYYGVMNPVDNISQLKEQLDPVLYHAYTNMLYSTNFVNLSGDGLEFHIYPCYTLNQAPISYYDYSIIFGAIEASNNLSGMFYNCKNLESFSTDEFNIGTNGIIISGLTTDDNITYIITGGSAYSYEGILTDPEGNTTRVPVTLINSNRGMFQGCTKLKKSPDFICSDDVHIVLTNNMYNGCSSLTELPVIDLSHVEVAIGMYKGCSSLQGNIILSMPKVEEITDIFNLCTSIESVKIDAPLCTKYSGVLNRCTSLVSADLNLGVTTSLTYISQAGRNLVHLKLAPNTIASPYMRLQQHAKLDTESVNSVIDALVKVEEGDTTVHKVQFESTVYNALTQEQKDAISAKGWVTE